MFLFKNPLKYQRNDVRRYAFNGGREFASFQTGGWLTNFRGLDKWHPARYSRKNSLRVRVINRSTNL